MKTPWYEKIYALYKGDDYIADGTIEEINKATGKSTEFLRYMTFPAYDRKAGDSTKRLRMVLIDDED